MNHSNHTKGFLYAALGSLSWGISGVCSQSLFMHYQLEASWLTAVRMVCSGILLLLITLPKDKANVFRIWTRPKDVIQLLAFALLGLLMCQYTFLCAIQYSNSATATVLQSLNVILMAVIIAIRNRKRMGSRQLFLAIKAWQLPSGLDATAWLLVASIVLIGTALGFSIFLEGVKLIGPVKATLIGCLEPASATALSALFLGTRFSLPELSGFCFIILTVFLSVTGSEKQL